MIYSVPLLTNRANTAGARHCSLEHTELRASSIENNAEQETNALTFSGQLKRRVWDEDVE
jgi:hypothetical protein